MVTMDMNLKTYDKKKRKKKKKKKKDLFCVVVLCCVCGVWWWGRMLFSISIFSIGRIQNRTVPFVVLGG